MPDQQSLREILENQLKILEEKEKRAEDLEAEARMLRAEANVKRSLILSALGTDRAEKDISIKSKGLKEAVYNAISDLGKKGSFNCFDVYNHIKNIPAARQERKKKIIKRLRSFLGRQTRAKKLISSRQGRFYVYVLPTSSGTKMPDTTDDTTPSIKEGSLALYILQAASQLEKAGSIITSRAVRSKLVESFNKTYDNLPLKIVASRIFYLRSVRKFMAVAKKTGNQTSYRITDAGYDALKKHGGE